MVAPPIGVVLLLIVLPAVQATTFSLGLVPKLAHVAASIPQFVLGGAGLVMFGMVAATGIKILSTVDYAGNRQNLFIIAVAISAGMIPLVAPTFFAQMPKVLSPILYSGILLTAFVAVLLNAFFNGIGSAAAARSEASAVAAQSEHV